ETIRERVGDGPKHLGQESRRDSLGAGRLTLPGADDFADAARRFNFSTGRSAEGVDADGQLLLQLAVTEDFHAVRAPVRQAEVPHRGFIHARAVFEPVQRFNTHRDVTGRKSRIVEAALGDPANQRHLVAFKADPDRAAGAGGLALAAPTAGLAVAAGFTLTEPFAAVLGAGTRFEIV